uniref:Serine protease n=1 Tax=Culex inatomii luteo-like virus TaxID=2683674 RepID=A0A6F8PYR2_9VIRU|nr:hypothetical protein 1 [Culex inatomii luteo-like virus]
MYKPLTMIMEDFLISHYALLVYVVLLVFLALTIVNVFNPCTKAVCMCSFAAVFVMFLRALALVTRRFFYMGVRGVIHVLGSPKFWHSFRSDVAISPEMYYTMLAFYLTLCLAISYSIWYKRREAMRHKYMVLDQSGTYMEEKAMPNSHYEVVPVLPGFQAAVLVSLDGITYRENGQCFWVDEGLLTAAHVVEGYDYCCIYRDEKHKIEVPSSVFETGQGDYACCRDPIKITQKVGLSKAKLACVGIEKGAGVSANIVARGKRSIGFLDQHSQFGFLTYSGSTTSGFSGAPYHLGRTIFGMHLGADSVNMGYEAAFLKTELRPSRVIKKLVDLKKEDSASWLVEQLGREDEVQYWRSPFDPSEYKLKVGNMYHIVDGEVLREILDRKKGRRAVDKIDYLEESDQPRETTARVVETRDMETMVWQYEVEESVKISGEIDLAEPVIAPTPAEDKIEDPLISTLRGLLQEFGRTSIYTSANLPAVKEAVQAPVKEAVEPVTPVVSKVDELPLAPRDAMTFNDSGNLFRAPAVPAGAPGMVSVPAPAQNLGQPIYGPMAFPYPPPLVNYHMESRSSMPAPQNVAFTRTQRNRARRQNRQRNRSELEQYRQLFGPIQPGGVISQPQPTQMPGSTENSIEH